MSGEVTFARQSEEHASLEDLFVQHQLALMQLDPERAAGLLERFERDLLAHARWEEDVLLPVYEERAVRTRHGAAEIFRSEHRKMAAHLERFRERLAALRPDARGLPRRILELLDGERIFKELLRHHSEREEKTLYPMLDAACSAGERAAMLAAAPSAEPPD